jgi:hypothetical protein
VPVIRFEGRACIAYADAIASNGQPVRSHRAHEPEDLRPVDPPAGRVKIHPNALGDWADVSGGWGCAV